MNESFLVIGSNSFSGASFVRWLLEQGYTVLGVSRSAEPHPVFLPYKWLASGQERFTFRQIDLNHDLEALMALLLRYQPPYIVNFAAQGMVAQSWEAPADWYQTNVLAQVRLHDRLRHLPFIKKYVHVSTPEVYGPTEGWLRESFSFAPSTPYAVSRAACDWHLMGFFKTWNFPVVFTRAANVYGPGQQLYRIIPRTLLFARTGRRLQLHGGGHSVRCFIHINDVAAATGRIALAGAPGTIYHISTSEPLTIRELVRQLGRLTDIPFESLVEETEDRPGKDQAYLLDSSRIQTELAWQPETDWAAGLRETLAWIDDNLNILQQLPCDYIHHS